LLSLLSFFLWVADVFIKSSRKQPQDCVWPLIKLGAVRLVGVIHGPLVEVEEYGVKGWRHQNVPWIAPNFVYLDGPELTRERQVAVDLLALEESFPPDCFLVIDDRQANTRFLRDHFKRRDKFTSRKYQGTNPTFELIG